MEVLSVVRYSGLQRHLVGGESLHLAMDQKEDLEIITKSSQQVDSTLIFFLLPNSNSAIYYQRRDSKIVLILLACVETGPGCRFPHSYNKNFTKETFLKQKENKKPQY